MHEWTTAEHGRARGRHRAPAPPRSRARWYLAGALVAVVAGIAVGAVYLTRLEPRWSADPPAPPPAISAEGPGERQPAGTPSLTSSANPTDQAGQPEAARPECRYEPAPADASAAPPPSRAELAGPVPVTLHTNQGDMVLELDATDAPCTVNAFVNLARAGYYADSSCHRLTTVTIFVLQCGDPTGTGTGTPGFRFNDENLPTGVAAPYARGTVAMANSGPNTNGGQFFLVYRDSAIDPNYPVLGRVIQGIEVLEKVAAAGAANNDGPPHNDVVITAVSMG